MKILARNEEEEIFTNPFWFSNSHLLWIVATKFHLAISVFTICFVLCMLYLKLACELVSRNLKRWNLSITILTNCLQKGIFELQFTTQVSFVKGKFKSSVIHYKKLVYWTLTLRGSYKFISLYTFISGLPNYFFQFFCWKFVAHLGRKMAEADFREKFFLWKLLSGKILIIDLWTKKLITNQIVKFFWI